jgi:hypothetical protein
LVGKSEVRRKEGRKEGRKPRGGSRREDNIKIDLKKDVKWTG